MKNLEGVNDIDGVEHVSEPAVPLFHWRSYRLFLLILLMFVFAVTSSNYMHMGITLVCMVNASSYEQTKIVQTDQCPNVIETSKAELGYTGELEWNPMQQSQLLAAFYYATMVTIGFSGALSDRFNGKFIITAAVMVYAVLSFISPWLANLHYYAFFISRLLMGLTEGFVFPCMTTIVSHWIPPNERTTAAAIYTSGHQIASLFSVLISATLCSISIGWPLIFYFFGILCLLAGIILFVFASNRPEENRFISKKEQDYLHEQLANEGLKKKHEKRSKTPWKAIFTSPVVFSIMASEISYQFSTSLFTYFLPSFFRDVMAFDMSQNGFYTAIPCFTQLLSKIVISIASDKLKDRYGWTATSSCKVLQTVSTFGTASTLCCMAFFLDCTRSGLAMILVALFGTFFAGEVAGAFTATLFIAPSFTGTLSSITTLVGSFGGIAAPTIFGLINQNGTREEWQYIFFIGAFVNVCAGVIFLLFGSAELQPWAVTNDQSKVYQIENEIKEKIDNKQ